MGYEEKVNMLIDDEQKKKMLLQMAQNLQKYKKVITHFGDDLDNKSSVYAVERWAREMGILEEGESLTVERVPAGQTKTRGINLDTGGHKGCSFDEETIIIDGGLQDSSAAMALSKLGIYVPEQIVKMADIPLTTVSPLEYRTGLALIRYLDGPNAFKLAEDGKLDQTLTDEDLERYGLLEASQKQKAVIDNAVAKVEKYSVDLPDGRKAVIASENILGGSRIAYELGCDFLASVESKEEGKCTFAMTAKPGTQLPKSVQYLGERLVEQYKREDGTSGVFLSPKKDMLVAGGFKNPDFRIETSGEKMVELLRDLMQIDDKDLPLRQKEIDEMHKRKESSNPGNLE